ncbi:Exocyst complex component SEC3 [Bienertia sinuspersici]
MGVYITQLSFNYLHNPVNWHNCVVGIFHDEQLPTIPLIQAMANTQWTTRRDIKIFKTSFYYIFECMHAMDKEAILHQHTVVFDGKLITFRKCDWYTVLSHLNFTTMRLWIRIFGLPLGFLNAQ